MCQKNGQFFSSLKFGFQNRVQIKQLGKKFYNFVFLCITAFFSLIKIWLIYKKISKNFKKNLEKNL